MNWLFINLVKGGYIQYESLVNGTLNLWDILKLAKLYEYDSEVKSVIQDYNMQELEKHKGKSSHKR